MLPNVYVYGKLRVRELGFSEIKRKLVKEQPILIQLNLAIFYTRC